MVESVVGSFVVGSLDEDGEPEPQAATSRKPKAKTTARMWPTLAEFAGMVRDVESSCGSHHLRPPASARAGSCRPVDRTTITPAPLHEDTVFIPTQGFRAFDHHGIRWSATELIDHLFPVRDPTEHAFALLFHELNVLLAEARRGVEGESPHPPKGHLVDREQFQMDVHPEHCFLVRNALFCQDPEGRWATGTNPITTTLFSCRLRVPDQAVGGSLAARRTLSASVTASRARSIRSVSVSAFMAFVTAASGRCACVHSAAAADRCGPRDYPCRLPG
jgi:hypothetical protein